MSSMRKKLLGALVVAIVALAALGVTIGTAAQKDGPQADPKDGSNVTLDPALAEKFSALMTVRQPEDAMPTSLAASLSGQLSADLVLNADLARRTGSHSGGRATYLVPGDGGLCVALVSGDIDESAGLACNSTTEIAADIIGPASQLGGCEASDNGQPPKCSATSIYGAVPDGVAKIVIQLQDGSTMSAKNGSNTYLFDLDGATEPQALWWQDSEGHVERRFRLAGP